MCEKPLGLHAGEVREMYRAAQAAHIVHMTAFTYRFAPSMRYLKHLLNAGFLGTPRHFRSQRFLDLPETSWGWRQYKDTAGAGDLFDMTIHRIDFAIDLLGPIQRICGAVAPLCTSHQDRRRPACAESEVDDWSSLIGEFACGAVGVWEGTTLRQRLWAQRIRARMGRDQWLGRFGRLSPARAQHALAGKNGTRPHAGQRPGGVSQPAGESA